MSRSIDGVVGSRQPAGILNAGAARPSRSGESPHSGAGGVIRRDPRLDGRVAARERSPERDGRAVARIAQPKKSWKERLQMPLIVIGGMLAGFAIQNALLGQILIIAFGAASLIYRVPSRISFALALTALLATTFFLIFLGNVVQGQTFATYTFLFLVVGVITLNRELKKEGGRVYNRRPRI